MRILSLTVLLLAWSCTACQENPPPPPVPSYTPEELARRLDRNTAEGTLRVFVIGMQVSDAPLLEQLAGPLPKDDLKLLLDTQRPTLSEEIQLQQGAALKIRHLQPGDKVRFADGDETLLNGEDVNATNQVLEIQTVPTPLRLRKIEDHWQIDATPLIALRRAARAKSN
jgi:hypothetical protein